MQTIPKQVLSKQLQPREKKDRGSADCAAFRAACRKFTVVIAEAVVLVPRVDVQYVDKKMFLNSWRRSAKFWDRS